MSSVCLSVRLSVCDVGGSGLHRLEISETNCIAQRYPPNPRGTFGNLGETRGGVGKNGVQEHKSGNISETRKYRGKVTMEGL